MPELKTMFCMLGVNLRVCNSVPGA